MIRIFALLSLMALAACAGPTPPPVPAGPWTALNQGQWTASQAEMETLPR